MTVFVLEAAPPALRGRLCVWMLEVRAGVYVGALSQKVRTKIWRQICEHLEDGNAVMMWKTASPQGFDFETHGKNRRKPVMVGDLKLVAFQSQDQSQPLEERGEDEVGIPYKQYRFHFSPLDKPGF